MVAFQTLDPEKQLQTRLPDSTNNPINLRNVIYRGMSILKKASEFHALASRYLDLVRRLQLKLELFSTRRQNKTVGNPDPTKPLSSALDCSQNPAAPAQGTVDSANPQSQMGELPIDFSNDFLDIENLFDSSWFDMSYNMNDDQFQTVS
jgi:hypothetical protein